MDTKNGNKNYFWSKALIIFLSLLLLLNGLGLIVAGKKVGKKNWVSAGIFYIVVEWLCSVTEVGIAIATILYFASIIHTALICSEYEQLLKEKDGISQQVNIKQSFVNMQKETVEDIKKENSNEFNARGIKFDRIPLKIGMAEVKGESRDKLIIRIQSETGRVYEFDTVGNSVKSYCVNGKLHNYGG